ncbi:hypothetical protein RRG08_001637 [Elysia crispata]|uniref:Uncharacterized protein n=1 Tax=Elysia crispata TaxID=231223 RepID=A0AAE1AK71_9GAST|nr:hypothetical protein RRG08_001637 [Elysia crispata]
MKYGVPAGATNVNNVSWWWPGEKYRYVLVYRANENERGDNNAKKINWCGVPHISLVRARGGSWSWRMHEDILAEKEQRIVEVVMVVVRQQPPHTAPEAQQTKRETTHTWTLNGTASTGPLSCDRHILGGTIRRSWFSARLMPSIPKDVKKLFEPFMTGVISLSVATFRQSYLYISAGPPTQPGRELGVTLSYKLISNCSQATWSTLFAWFTTQ